MTGAAARAETLQRATLPLATDRSGRSSLTQARCTPGSTPSGCSASRCHKGDLSCLDEVRLPRVQDDVLLQTEVADDHLAARVDCQRAIALIAYPPVGAANRCCGELASRAKASLGVAPEEAEDPLAEFPGGRARGRRVAVRPHVRLLRLSRIRSSVNPRAVRFCRILKIPPRKSPVCNRVGVAAAVVSRTSPKVASTTVPTGT